MSPETRALVDVAKGVCKDAADRFRALEDPVVIPASLSDERDWWQQRLLAAERAAWLAGYEAGNRDGYLHGTRQMQAGWPAIVAPVLADRPAHAELEKLRYGPGGREGAGERRQEDRFPAQS